jgi:hypothetical protein
MADKEFDIDTITIDIGEDSKDTCIDITSMASTSYNFNMPTYSIGAIGSSGSFLTSSGSNGTSWNTIGTSKIQNALSVTGDAEFEGDVKIKGVSIAKALEDIQSRLAILVPDPAKLEHFAALKKAYEHYKTLEALCEIPKQENEE